ncbi:MAG: hypothetical protein IIW27_04345, partial [Clostridia bacterium]|nr:hypothetical protein [Clostridia bacterium]
MKEMQKERQERQLERLRILKEAGALQDEPESPQGEALSIAETPQTDDVAPKAEGENAAN